MPGAFRLDDPAVEAVEEAETLEELEPVEADAHQAVEAIVHPPRRGIRWGALALVDRRRARRARARPGASMRWCATSSPAPAGSAGSASALIALFVARRCSALVGREVLGLFRLKRLARLRLDGDDAALRNDRDAAVAAHPQLIALYGGRPDTAMARRRVAAHLGEIIDGRDLLMLAERDLSRRSTRAPRRSPPPPRGGSRW